MARPINLDVEAIAAEINAAKIAAKEAQLEPAAKAAWDEKRRLENSFATVDNDLSSEQGWEEL
jgi:hypothetical protein